MNKAITKWTTTEFITLFMFFFKKSQLVRVSVFFRKQQHKQLFQHPLFLSWLLEFFSLEEFLWSNCAYHFKCIGISSSWVHWLVLHCLACGSEKLFVIFMKSWFRHAISDGCFLLFEGGHVVMWHVVLGACLKLSLICELLLLISCETDENSASLLHFSVCLC